MRIRCEKCGHLWNYNGKFSHRIRCPHCRSSRNKRNWKIFGKWRPTSGDRRETK